MLPRTRWIVRVFYAVLKAADKERRSREDRGIKRKHTPEHLVHTKRCELALIWIDAFWQHGNKMITRVFSFKAAAKDLAIIVDASPWGVGGILAHIATGKVIQVAASRITESDEKQLGVKIGFAGSQGILETLAIWVFLHLWRRFFTDRQRVPILRSDSRAAISSAEKLASGTPFMNHLAAELALMMELHDIVTPEVRHLPGKLNVCADHTSRIYAPPENQEPVPPELTGVRIRDVVVPSAGRPFLLPTASLRPDLWSGSVEDEAE